VIQYNCQGDKEATTQGLVAKNKGLRKRSDRQRDRQKMALKLLKSFIKPLDKIRNLWYYNYRKKKEIKTFLKNKRSKITKLFKKEKVSQNYFKNFTNS